MSAKRILFAGYAPVHFLCFLPIYRQLVGDPRVEVFLSGGFKENDENGTRYSLRGFYEPFAVEPSRVIPIEQARGEDFDVLVCSHLSDDFFPRTVGRTVQLFHGVSFKNLAVRDKALRYDILCLPGRYHAEMYQKNGLVRANGSLCLITGFPKCDPLANREMDRHALLSEMRMNPALPTILFAPTGEKHNALETAGEALIRCIAAVKNWNLLIKPHDHPKNQIDWFGRLEEFESDQVRTVKGRDVIPYLNAADVLMTDASSVAVEYTLLNRPILFIDVPKLFKKVQKRAPAMDLETYGRKIGRIVKTPEEITKAIQDALRSADAEDAIRRAMAEHVFHRPGSATARVRDVILYAAGLSNELPEGVLPVNPEAGSATALRAAA